VTVAAKFAMVVASTCWQALSLLALLVQKYSVYLIYWCKSTYFATEAVRGVACQSDSQRQHTSAYVSIRQHTSAYVSRPRGCLPVRFAQGTQFTQFTCFTGAKVLSLLDLLVQKYGTLPPKPSEGLPASPIRAGHSVYLLYWCKSTQFT